MSAVQRSLRPGQLPVNALPAGTVTGRTASARGGQQSLDHPAHVRLRWADGAEQQVWGLVSEWNAAAVRVLVWSRGEHRLWLAREDVEACTCAGWCELVPPLPPVAERPSTP